MIKLKKRSINGVNKKSFEEIFYTVVMKAKLTESEEDIRNGRVMTLEEFRKRIMQKYEDCNI